MKPINEMRIAYHPRLVGAESAPHGAVIALNEAWRAVEPVESYCGQGPMRRQGEARIGLRRRCEAQRCSRNRGDATAAAVMVLRRIAALRAAGMIGAVLRRGDRGCIEGPATDRSEALQRQNQRQQQHQPHRSSLKRSHRGKTYHQIRDNTRELRPSSATLALDLQL
jgi:hypothetical protein